jgi:hypothetical protein
MHILRFALPLSFTHPPSRGYSSHTAILLLWEEKESAKVYDVVILLGAFASLVLPLHYLRVSEE